MKRPVISSGPGQTGTERQARRFCWMSFLTAMLALGLALIHLTIGRLRFLDSVPRSIWLSGAGGVAVAYVFLHILPDLAAYQETVAAQLGMTAELAEMTVFAIGLSGLTAFYGLERLARSARKRSKGEGPGNGAGAGVFWIHVGSFALYNALVGYLLVHREVPGLPSLVLFFVAMAMHFVTNDFGLREHHRERYDHRARWLLAVAVLAGWMTGISTGLPDLAVAFLFAFLAGGVVLNVLKEELPEDRQSRFLPFLLGAGGYSVVLVAVNLV